MRLMRVRPPVTAPIRMPSAREIPAPANDNHPAARETRLSLLIGRSLLIIGVLATSSLVLGLVGWLGRVAWKALH